MPFSKKSQNLMTQFFHVFDTFSYNKTKTKQSKMDTIFKKFYNELVISSSIYDKCYESMVTKTVIEVDNIKKIPGIDLVDSKYSSSLIKKEIMENGSDLLKFDLKLQGINVEIYFLLFGRNGLENLRTYDLYVKDIFVFLKFLLFFMKGSNTKSISYYLFLTNIEKKLPTTKLKVLSSENCNTGLTFGCVENARVLVYRKEEWFKVFIHETIHMFCLDFNNMHLEKFHRKFSKLLKINSDFNLYESYTEFWALIFHSIFIASKLVGEIKNDKSFLLYLDFILHYEKIFSLYQCVKVLDFMGLKYEMLLSDDTIDYSLKQLYYKENTNVFAYYIAKMVLFYYREDFIIWCNKNNKKNVFNFTKTEENLDLFFDFLKSKIYGTDLLKDIKQMEDVFKSIKSKGISSNYVKNTLRMTVAAI